MPGFCCSISEVMTAFLQLFCYCYILHIRTPNIMLLIVQCQFLHLSYEITIFNHITKFMIYLAVKSTECSIHFSLRRQANNLLSSPNYELQHSLPIILFFFISFSKSHSYLVTSNMAENLETAESSSYCCQWYGM